MERRSGTLVRIGVAAATLAVLSGCSGVSAAGKKVVLFDGADFSHWTQADGQTVRWKLADGAMEVVPGSGSIVTKDAYRDFKLHIEFNVPPSPTEAKGQARGNSGVYLQRRYEVQILDSYGLKSKKNDCGAIYGVKAPDCNVCKQPGEWQTYDITFRAARYEGAGPDAKKIANARITVRQNGVLIHDNVEIPGKTGAGAPEGPAPGPILLQDHGNKVQFRNIWIEPLN